MSATFLPMLGDCIELLSGLPDESIDAIPTDGPYGLGFMGRTWDTFRPGVETARVIAARESDNPNVRGRLRSPASSPSAVEYDRSLAGQRAFQAFTAEWATQAIRVLKPGGYLASFGAPRSHHRMMSGLEDAGFEIRDCLMWLFGQGFPKSKNLGDGWGTALKPAWEPIALARKPLGKLTASKARAQFGTGGINIDACRTEGDRWPASVILDPEAADLLGPQSRFFYCPKVSTWEREFGCEHLPARSAGEMTGGRKEGSAGLNNPRAGAGRTSGSHNAHPTVKPLALMRWLIRLITPPEGTIVDPFIGSGTTAVAAVLEGHDCIGMDREEEWLTVADARVAAWLNLPTSEIEKRLAS